MKRILVAVSLALFIVGLAVSYPAYAQNNQGRIEGHITNLTIGGPPAEPLPSVEVLVNEWMSLRSGRNGEWNITGLPPGDYSVRLNLPPGYSPAQDVVTATIWGDNTEVLDLAFYQGDVPLPTPALETTPVVTDIESRVQPLGSTPTPVVTPEAVAMADTVTTTSLANMGTTASATTTTASTTERPAQAGYRLPGGYSMPLLSFLGVVGIVVAGLGVRQLWEERKSDG